MVITTEQVVGIARTPNGIARTPNDERDDSPAALLKETPGSVGPATTPTPSGRRDASARRPSLSARLARFKLRKDYRADLHPLIARFTGYRPASSSPPYPPLLTLISRTSLKTEVVVTGTIASFIAILLVQSISATHTAFRDLNSPLVVASLGATAVLMFGALESPLSQPRNVIFGQLFSAIVGVCLTRLFAIDKTYIPALDNRQLHYGTFINGPLSMAAALLVMFLTGTIHPPGGATALLAATSREAAELSWDFIPFVLASTLVMFGWAMVINNIGRRRYPVYWWKPGKTFVREEAETGRRDEEIALGRERDNVLRRAEDGGRSAEAFKVERLQEEGGQGQGGQVGQAGQAISTGSGISAQERGRQNKRTS